MSHTVHPYSHRIGILRGWKSRWFAPNGKYQQFLKCDVLLREYIVKRLRGNYVAGVEIERGQKTLRIIIKSSRPGMIIGRSGENMLKLRADIETFIKRQKIVVKEELKIDVEEVKNPEANAAIVAQMVAEGLEKRLPFRRVVKQMLEKVMANREVKGIKIYLGGRLGGAEMARTEELKKGQVPLQTLRADIDFARERANMTYGVIGIKVWIYRGMKFDTTNKVVANKKENK